MATKGIYIDVDTDAGTLDRLGLAIGAYQQELQRTTSDATVAAGINILRSLKASTKQAKRGSDKGSAVTEAMYRIVRTNMYGGFKGSKGSHGYKVCARVGSHYGPVSHIRPAMGFAPTKGAVLQSVVYAIYTTNTHDRFKSNVNAPAQCWYVLCQHEGQAESYAKRHIARLLRKESGMAKYTLGIAQAKLSTRSKVIKRDDYITKGSMSPKAAGLAYDSAELSIQDTGYNDGIVSVYFSDALRYSQEAAGGSGALVSAIDKATRSMLGHVDKVAATCYSKAFSKQGTCLGARMSIPWRWN